MRERREVGRKAFSASLIALRKSNPIGKHGTEKRNREAVERESREKDRRREECIVHILRRRGNDGVGAGEGQRQ